MRKHYQSPDATFIALSLLEDINLDLGDISNPFVAAVAEDEAAEEAAREAAMAAAAQK